MMAQHVVLFFLASNIFCLTYTSPYTLQLLCNKISCNSWNIKHIKVHKKTLTKQEKCAVSCRFCRRITIGIDSAFDAK